MNYAEAAYFDGDHCAHVGVWQQLRWNRERDARLKAKRTGNRPQRPRYFNG